MKRYGSARGVSLVKKKVSKVKKPKSRGAYTQNSWTPAGAKATNNPTKFSLYKPKNYDKKPDKFGKVGPVYFKKGVEGKYNYAAATAFQPLKAVRDAIPYANYIIPDWMVDHSQWYRPSKKKNFNKIT